LVISDEPFACLWPKSLLMPIEWMPVEELHLGMRSGARRTAEPTLLDDGFEGMAELPWPAEPRSLVEHRHVETVEMWCNESRQVFDGGRQQANLAPEFDLSADVSSSAGFYVRDTAWSP
ncbi:unnamed protein product, partial [Symbiodinium natans]